jgi:hypothetical protein
MTAISPSGSIPSPSTVGKSRPSYAYAHWYMLAAFAVVVAGFWPTFYQPLTGGTTLRNVHGVTSTLWYMALVLQPWLVTNGYVRWHKRVAVVVIALLPVLCISALMTTRLMLQTSGIPLPVRPLIAYLDITLVTLFVVLFGLGLLNRRTPAAHKRYMVSTALLGFPPALTRFISRTFALDPLIAIHFSFFIVELILLTLIVVDWRRGERRRWAYPAALVTHVVIQLLMMPVSFSPWWGAFARWFAAGPMTG